jgi:SAM-dependent methyltransferase
VRAVADALVGLGLLARVGGRYALTAESETYLVSQRPASLAPFFKHMGRQLLPAWLELPRIMRTGQPSSSVNRQDQGAEFFSEFVESLFPLSYAAARALGEHLGLPSATAPVQVLDLGAGSGVWGIALAQMSAQVQVTAVDWPRVLDVTRRMAAKSGVRDRVRGVGGDLLMVEFGVGHRIATIGHILHSEGVDRSRELLRRTFHALEPGGTVAVMEFLVNEERTGPAPSLMFAVNMLVHSECGDAFTFTEIRAWMEEAGFVDVRLLEVPGPSPLVLGTRPVG